MNEEQFISFIERKIEQCEQEYLYEDISYKNIELLESLEEYLRKCSK